MRKDTGQVFRIEDYRPSDYLIPRTSLAFALSPDGRRLFVTAHFEPHWGGAVDVRRVYDVAEDVLTR